MGAGPYDRRLVRQAPPAPYPQQARCGGGALTGSGAIPKQGTLTLQDSLTYTAVDPVWRWQKGCLTFCGLPTSSGPSYGWRPTPGGWTELVFDGAAGSCLVLDGLFVSGADLVLTGSFDCVTLTCCTLDPGTTAPPPTESAASSPYSASAAASVFATAADCRDLVPTRLWIEGQVGTLTVAKCITGPIRTRFGGQVQTLCISDSIIRHRPIPTAGYGHHSRLRGTSKTRAGSRAGCVSLMIHSRRTCGASRRHWHYLESGPGLASVPYSAPCIPHTLERHKRTCGRPTSICTHAPRFSEVALSAATRAVCSHDDAGPASRRRRPELNRLVLEDAFPRDLADLALAFNDGDVNQSRCTVLGRVAVHRLQASECILGDLAQVDDTQHGCVRFCAWAVGNALAPRHFESVQIAQKASLLTSTDFGQPGYGQLLPTVDAAIIPAAGPARAAFTRRRSPRGHRTAPRWAPSPAT